MERGLVATSSGPGATARRVSGSASGSRPQTQTGSSGGQTQPLARSARNCLTRRSSSEWKEIAARRPPIGSIAPGGRQRVLERVELAVDGDPDRLEGPLGRVAAAEAGRGRHPGFDRVDQLGGRRERPAAADLAGDPAGVALLAEAAQRLRDPRLGPLVDEVGGAQLLAGVHAHVEGGVVGIGEAPLPGVDLHRGHSEVHVDHLWADAFAAQGAKTCREVAAK